MEAGGGSAKKGGKAGGRKAGAINYKPEILMNIVEAVKPAGSLQWAQVAERYKSASGEVTVRDPADVKRYFMQKCCNNGKKPTGQSGSSKTVAKGLKIWAAILKKESSISMADEDDEDSDEDDEDDDDEEEEDGEGGDGHGEGDEEEAYNNYLQHEAMYAVHDRGVSSAADYAACPPVIGGSSSSSSSGAGPSSSSAAPTPAVRKRKADTPPDRQDNKSKNARPFNPRGGAAGALINLADRIGENQQMVQMQNMMSMVMQQAQQQAEQARQQADALRVQMQQAQQQAQQQAAQQQQQFMMLLMGRGPVPGRMGFGSTPPHVLGQYQAASSASSQASRSTAGHTDSTGDVSMSEDEINNHFL